MCVGSCGSQKKASDSSETVMDSCYGCRKLNSGRAVLLTPRPSQVFLMYHILTISLCQEYSPKSLCFEISI